MNTPDTEWRERLWEWVEVAPSGVEVLNCYPESVVAIIEQALSSRDTYWKERVEKLWGMLDDIDSVPDMLHPNTERGHESTWRMMVAIAEKRHKILKTDGFTLTPITNEDKLK